MINPYIEERPENQYKDQMPRLAKMTIPIYAHLLFSLTLAHLFFPASTNNTNHTPYPFVTWDAGRIAGKEFDYIVVGGGAAGCPLAVTLSRQFSVLLLERGTSPFGNPDIERGDAYSKPLSYADNYTSIAQIFTSEDGVANARARVLGGGTAINAGFYSRGSRKMVLGDMGLDEVLVNQSYHWIESKLVHRPLSLTTWSIAIRDALLDAGVYPYNGFTLDHLEGTKYGGSIFDQMGMRHVATELLDYANGSNMMVLLNSTVGRILFRSGGKGARPRAYGVEFEDRNRFRYTAELNRRKQSEVILCAGALGSPQLLMLSGIGPAAHLKSLGIPVVVESPAVGKGMADNPGTNVALLSSKPLGWSPLQIVGITPRTYLEGGSRYIESSKAYRGGLFQKVAFPNSRGEMWLKNRDPRENPSVKFNYYADPEDLKICIDGARIQSAVFRSPVLQRFGYRNPTTGKLELRYLGMPPPEDVGNLTVMEEYCRNSVATIYHYHGGCGVGSVIDSRNRVMGVKSLRIVDSSTFRDSPGTNPQATTMMLGRYKALKILEERDQCI